MAFCKNCGKEIPDNTKFCTYCGAKNLDAPGDNASSNNSSAFGWALLGFFIPLVGLILYLVWRDDTPLRAKSAGKGALAAVIVYGALYVILLLTTTGAAGCIACSALH